MKRKSFFLICLSVFILTPAKASEPLQEKVSKAYDLSGKTTEQIGITLRYNGRTQKEFFVEGTYVSVRALFEDTADRIAWDHKSKVATIPTPNAEPHGIGFGLDGAVWFAEECNQIGRLVPPSA